MRTGPGSAGSASSSYLDTPEHLPLLQQEHSRDGHHSLLLREHDSEPRTYSDDRSDKHVMDESLEEEETWEPELAMDAVPFG